MVVPRWRLIWRISSRMDSPCADSSEPESSQEESSSEGGEATQKSSITPLMWKITSDDGNEMILMGSMHALKDECYPLPERIMKAYENAEVIACEFDLVAYTSDLSASLALMNESMYEDSAETIAQHLSKETVDGLTDFFAAEGYSMDIMKHYKPWMILSQCESIITEKCGLDAQQGIDMNLLQMAHDDGKEIFETESADFQMGMLMGFSDELNDLLLSSYNADNIEELEKNMNDTYDMWKTGDIEKTTAFLTQEDEATYGELTDADKALLDEYNKAMLYDRNEGMTECAEKLLKEHKNTFFVVGLAHFIFCLSVFLFGRLHEQLGGLLAVLVNAITLLIALAQSVLCLLVAFVGSGLQRALQLGGLRLGVRGGVGALVQSPAHDGLRAGDGDLIAVDQLDVGVAGAGEGEAHAGPGGAGRVVDAARSGAVDLRLLEGGRPEAAHGHVVVGGPGKSRQPEGQRMAHRVGQRRIQFQHE